MTTQSKLQIGGAFLCLILGAAFGHYATPARVEIKTVEVEKKTETKKVDAEKDKHKETTVTETTKPDGTKETVTKTTEDTKTDTHSTDASSSTTSTTSSTITTARPSLRLSALLGTPLTSPTPVYGLSVSKDVLGPISIGAWGLSTGTVGLSVGISF